MSMNLAFSVKGGGMIDFPFQTPTDLTCAVLKEKNREKRLDLLEKAMQQWTWDDEDIQGFIMSISSLMDNPNLELTMI